MSMHTLEAAGLDPVTLFINDVQPGQGRLVVECYGCAWSCWWGSMGNGKSVLQFVAGCDEHYIANCLIRARRQFISSRKMERSELDYLARICAAIIIYAQSQGAAT